MEQDLLSAGYDAVYAAMPNSPTARRIWHELAEGPDVPEEFGHLSFTTLPELQRMAAELRVGPGDTFADVGCGTGGPALWMARETGARLIGMDLSAVVVEQCRARAEKLGLADRARFVVGTFQDTGLDTASVDGLMSEDALQYTPDKQTAAAELARVLRPGGRLVITAYELHPERAAGTPILGVDVVDDYRPHLEKAGLDVDIYEQVTGWPEPMTACYSAFVEAKEALTQEMGENPTNALLMEMSLTLEERPYRHRVLFAATKK
jgi:ubiquinone/menaquinone biosynthesis C-methylase UbiE